MKLPQLVLTLAAGFGLFAQTGPITPLPTPQGSKALQVSQPFDLDGFLREFRADLGRDEPFTEFCSGTIVQPGVQRIPEAPARERLRVYCDHWLARIASERSRHLPERESGWLGLIAAHLEEVRFRTVELREREWNPDLDIAEFEYTHALILSGDYAPLEKRLGDLSTRLEATPAYFAALRANLHCPLKADLESAITDLEGFTAGIAGQIRESAMGSRLAPADRDLLLKRLAVAKAAAEGHIQWLRKKLANPGQEGFRPVRFDETQYGKFFALRTQADLTAPEALHRAEADRVEAQARMAAIADGLWPRLFPNQAKPSDRHELTFKVLEKFDDDHPKADDYLPLARRIVADAKKWVEDHQLLTLSHTHQLEVRVAPPALAAVGSPLSGQLTPGTPCWFTFWPMNGKPEEMASLMRRKNLGTWTLLCVHEACPGHFAQADHTAGETKGFGLANRALTEGWAMYSEQMLLESGFGGDRNPEFWLAYHRDRLMDACLTTIDHEMNVHGMGEAEALAFLRREGIMSEGHARWALGIVTEDDPLWILSYPIGGDFFLDLRDEVKRRHGAKFSLKAFNDRVLDCQNMTPRDARRFVLAQPSQESLAPPSPSTLPSTPPCSLRGTTGALP